MQRYKLTKKEKFKVLSLGGLTCNRKIPIDKLWFPIIDDKLDMFVKIVNRTFGSELTHIEEDMNLYRSPDKINVQQRRYYGKIL